MYILKIIAIVIHAYYYKDTTSTSYGLINYSTNQPQFKWYTSGQHVESKSYTQIYLVNMQLHHECFANPYAGNCKWPD